MSHGTVYWITGISGAGKSTVGGRLYERLKASRPQTVYLDGDALREILAQDLGHTREDRKRCAERYGRLCRLLSEQGVDVVIATISLFHEVHDWNRRHIPGYREIFLKTDIGTVAARDPKAIYRAAREGKGGPVVGLDIPAEEPRNPDLTLVNDGTASPDSLVDRILTHFRKSA